MPWSEKESTSILENDSRNERRKKGSAIINFADHREQMLYNFHHGKPKGDPTHFWPIDQARNFSWRKGHITTWTGNPNNGKTEFLCQLAEIKSLRDGWKWAGYLPESYPIEELLDTMVHALVGKSTDPQFGNQMSQREYVEALDWLDKYFTFIDFQDMPELNDVLREFEDLEVDGIIIDPFNAIDDDGDNIARYLKRSLTQCALFARRKDIVFNIVEHPHSANSLDDKGQPREPTEYTLHGGKMWHNKSYMIVVYHRPFIYDDDMGDKAIFRSRKIKNQKLNGYPGVCEFRFDRKTNRFCWRDPSTARTLTAFDEPITYEEEQLEAPF